MAVHNVQKNSTVTERAQLLPARHDDDSDSDDTRTPGQYGTVEDTEAARPDETSKHDSGLVTKVVGALFIG